MPLRLQRYDNFGNYANIWGILCEKLEEELNTQRRDYNDNTDNMYARQQCEREGKRIEVIHRKDMLVRAEVV